MIDLHSHTNSSDGTLTPAQLVDLAKAQNLEALAITDHDTFEGYDAAVPLAAEAGLDLVCGIEVSTRFRGKSVHLLGYFLNHPPMEGFRNWLLLLQESRRERNKEMVHKLNAMGIGIRLEDVEMIGRSITGRPHFARALVQQGYCKSIEEAFRIYLGEGARAYVDRKEVNLPEAITLVRDGGGIPVLAHPIRLGKVDRAEEERWISEITDSGLLGLEVFHSDHKQEDVERYQSYTRKFQLAQTGGSDYHGDNKPDIQLGQGRKGNLNVPLSILDDLRRNFPNN